MTLSIIGMTQEELENKVIELEQKLTVSTQYSEYLAEQLEKTIKYSEYLAEKMEKHIDDVQAYSEYVKEHITKDKDRLDEACSMLNDLIDYIEDIRPEDSLDFTEWSEDNDTHDEVDGDNQFFSTQAINNLNRDRDSDS